MKNMTESDAKELVAAEGDGWEMPSEWWQIESDDLMLQVTEEVALGLLGIKGDSWAFICSTNSDYWKFEDLYGATIYMPKSPAPLIFKTTELARAKWLLGMPERNWKPDEKPDWEAGS